MIKFLTGHNLNSQIESIFEKAEEKIILISPYIKLHDRYIRTLMEKKESPKISITVVFGKNENNLSKSMKLEDFNFLKDFPNIEIRYEPKLHAKYYANEYRTILTSMNLYSYSVDTNIEAGILYEPSITGIVNMTDSYDKECIDYFDRVIRQAQLLFKRVPVFESKLFGLTKKHLESTTEVDTLSEHFGQVKHNENTSIATVHKQSNKPSPDANHKSGYCIRTGKTILFNQKMPMSEEAYHNWMKFKNDAYPEKFCHFSGEPSHGETSFGKPILKTNWKHARDVHGF